MQMRYDSINKIKTLEATVYTLKTENAMIKFTH